MPGGVGGSGRAGPLPIRCGGGRKPGQSASPPGPAPPADPNPTRSNSVLSRTLRRPTPCLCTARSRRSGAALASLSLCGSRGGATETTAGRHYPEWNTTRRPSPSSTAWRPGDTSARPWRSPPADGRSARLRRAGARALERARRHRRCPSPHRLARTGRRGVAQAVLLRPARPSAAGRSRRSARLSSGRRPGGVEAQAARAFASAHALAPAEPQERAAVHPASELVGAGGARTLPRYLVSRSATFGTLANGASRRPAAAAASPDRPGSRAGLRRGGRLSTGRWTARAGAAAGTSAQTGPCARDTAPRRRAA
jgi:hypothetical protein